MTSTFLRCLIQTRRNEQDDRTEGRDTPDHSAHFRHSAIPNSTHALSIKGRSGYHISNQSQNESVVGIYHTVTHIEVFVLASFRAFDPSVRMQSDANSLCGVL